MSTRHSPDALPPRLTRRTVVFSLAFATLGGALVSCVGQSAVAVPQSGQIAKPAPPVQAVAKAVTPNAPAPATAATAVPTQPPTNSSAPTTVAQPVATNTAVTQPVAANTAVPTAAPAIQPTAMAPVAPTSTAASATPLPAPTRAPAATAVPAPAAPPPTTTVVVEMNDQMKFSPISVTVTKGSTVVWKNVGTMPHTITFDPAKAANKASVALPNGVQPFGSDYVMAGQSYSHTFTVAGTYRYICIPHEMLGMLGSVIVK